MIIYHLLYIYIYIYILNLLHCSMKSWGAEIKGQYQSCFTTFKLEPLILMLLLLKMNSARELTKMIF